jgi:hypothetical protein
VGLFDDSIVYDCATYTPFLIRMNLYELEKHLTLTLLRCARHGATKDVLVMADGIDGE